MEKVLPENKPIESFEIEDNFRVSAAVSST
jgi:hypothetical protein